MTKSTITRNAITGKYVVTMRSPKDGKLRYLGTFKTATGAARLDQSDRVFRSHGDLVLKYRVTPAKTVQVRTFDAALGERIFIGTFENKEVAKHNGELYVAAQLRNREE